jgi:hypothetical protein
VVTLGVPRVARCVHLLRSDFIAHGEPAKGSQAALGRAIRSMRVSPCIAAFLATAASPTPAPSPSSATSNGGGSQIPAAVIVGALIGAVATVVAEIIAKIIGNYRSYRFVLGLLKQEVTAIENQVSERQRHPEVIVPLYGPLPTKAWETLIVSHQRRYMGKKKLEALNSLYQAVATANDYAYLMPVAVQISQLASEQNTRDTYRDETIRLLKDPLSAIEQALPKAREMLDLPSSALSIAAQTAGDQG